MLMELLVDQILGARLDIDILKRVTYKLRFARRKGCVCLCMCVYVCTRAFVVRARCYRWKSL